MEPNPFFNVKPLAPGAVFDVPHPETGAAFLWNPMVKIPQEPVATTTAGGMPCGNLAIAVADDPMDGFVNSAGTVGDLTIPAGDAAGAGDGDSVYVKVTLDGSDGTYTVELTLTEPTTSATVKGRLIATISPEGVPSQVNCGPINLLVCRDWYASSSPYYTISLS